MVKFAIEGLKITFGQRKGHFPSHWLENDCAFVVVGLIFGDIINCVDEFVYAVAFRSCWLSLTIKPRLLLTVDTAAIIADKVGIVALCAVNQAIAAKIFASLGGGFPVMPAHACAAFELSPEHHVFSLIAQMALMNCVRFFDKQAAIKFGRKDGLKLA